MTTLIELLDNAGPFLSEEAQQEMEAAIRADEREKVRAEIASDARRWANERDWKMWSPDGGDVEALYAERTALNLFADFIEARP